MTIRNYSILSAVLVLFQFAALGCLILTGPLLARDMPIFLLQLLGALVACAALWQMAGTRWHIRPDVHPNARLITRGIYRRIRHPMYTATILITLSWLYLRFTPLRVQAFALLLVVILIKIFYEERALTIRFGKAYTDYKRYTKRLIPHIF